METQEKTTITVQNTIQAPVHKVWEYWTKPEHITHWNFATDEWHSPWAKSDMRVGGSFSARMEARDGSMGFDFGGVYDAIRENEYIEYTLGDGRKVKIHFIPEGNATKVVESFEAESENSIELQRGGWQAILDNFKKYTESN
ncbi:MAG TPA: SRPBCC family protein [Chitinophagaceae bacterium]|nr:SRPBCC family protein [Chitinophagaceae bacterium]